MGQLLQSRKFLCRFVRINAWLSVSARRQRYRRPNRLSLLKAGSRKAGDICERCIAVESAPPFAAAVVPTVLHHDRSAYVFAARAISSHRSVALWVSMRSAAPAIFTRAVAGRINASSLRREICQQ